MGYFESVQAGLPLKLFDVNRVLTLQSKNAHKRVIITREPKVGCLIEKRQSFVITRSKME